MCQQLIINCDQGGLVRERSKFACNHDHFDTTLPYNRKISISVGRQIDFFGAESRNIEFDT